MVVAVGVAAWAGPARAQEQEAAPPPPAAAGDQPLGEEEAMVLNFERARLVAHPLHGAAGADRYRAYAALLGGFDDASLIRGELLLISSGGRYSWSLLRFDPWRRCSR